MRIEEENKEDDLTSFKITYIDGTEEIIKAHRLSNDNNGLLDFKCRDNEEDNDDDEDKEEEEDKDNWICSININQIKKVEELK